MSSTRHPLNAYPRPGEKYPEGPLGPNPANDTVVRAGDAPTESLHEQNLRLQRRSRIQRRRERILFLNQFTLDGESTAEIKRLQDEIRADGEEP